MKATSTLPRPILNGYSRTLTPNARKRIARMVRCERRYAPRWAIKSSVRTRIILALERYVPADSE